MTALTKNTIILVVLLIGYTVVFAKEEVKQTPKVIKIVLDRIDIKMWPNTYTAPRIIKKEHKLLKGYRVQQPSIDRELNYKVTEKLQD